MIVHFVIGIFVVYYKRVAEIDDENILKGFAKLELTEIDLQPTEDPKHFKAVAHLAASKATVEEMSYMLGMDVVEIQKILSLERIKGAVHDIQRRQFARDPQAHLKSFLPDAIDVVGGIVRSPTEKTVFKLKAAQDVMDRNMGKANQNISIQSGGISELFDKIDNIERSLKDKVIEAESRNLGDNVEEAEIVDSLVRKSKWKQWADENK